ncbi:MAG TPA: hypothetical protein VKR05_00280 [Candidatus Cybelea sp.]|nr:hypothetical protein [Candidatus Cybelea sp.]
MRVAGFSETPHANEVAAILRDQCYEVEIVSFDGTADPGRLSDLCEVIRSAGWAKILVISNCESDYFGQLVANNYGSVIYQGRIAMAA